ncbi:MAG TPA: carbohydrate kinase family protein [Phycisphaeraceae bacterium]
MRRWAPEAPAVPVMLGFDGFVDSIIQVVDQRRDIDHYEPIRTISQLAQRVAAAAGHSTNMELVTLRQKLGGNGPIMANALAAAGLEVTYIGAVGQPELHPVFADLAQRAKVHSIAAPGFTDALEFADGKLLLGKYDHLARMGYEQIRQTLGEEAFRTIVARSRLVGMVNWTMLPRLETVWEELVERVLPEVGPMVNGRRRLIFIDLADPEKRTRQDLARALSQCTRLNRHADVILGLNLKEAIQAAAAVDIPIGGEPEQAIETTARRLRERLELAGVVIHPRRCAAAAIQQDKDVHSARFEGPFVASPKLSTGAGDNFNAGFCLGLLAGLSVEQALCTGTATSGYYVRHAASPTLEQLAAFCEDLPAPEPC